MADLADQSLLDDDAPAIEVRGLRSQFGDHVVHDNLDLTVERGEVLGVVGESGAGKSVTGAAIIGLVDPPGRIAAGEIDLAGRRIDRRRLAEHDVVRAGLERTALRMRGRGQRKKGQRSGGQRKITTLH